MNYVSSVLTVLVVLIMAQLAMGQEVFDEPYYNTTKEHQIGVGFATTSFSGSFSYYVSPYYAFRTSRHTIAFNPFYGRLDPLPRQQDVGVGFEYRIYPFKNLNRIRYYAPLSIHYIYTWLNDRTKHGMFYTLGVGSDTDLGKHFLLSLDVKFGLGQTLHTSSSGLETLPFDNDNELNFYFLPNIRLAYKL